MKRFFIIYTLSLLAFYELHAFAPAIAAMGSQPEITFTENKGQVGDQYFKHRPDVLYTGSAANSTFYLRQTGISYQFNRVDEWREKKDKFMNAIKEPARATIYRLDI